MCYAPRFYLVQPDFHVRSYGRRGYTMAVYTVSDPVVLCKATFSAFSGGTVIALIKKKISRFECFPSGRYLDAPYP